MELETLTGLAFQSHSFDVIRRNAMNEKCPECGSINTVSGRYLDQAGAGLAPVFRPDGLKHLTLGGTDVRVPSKDRFTACLDCGLLWARIPAEKVAKVMVKKGKQKSKEALGLTGN